MKKSWLMILPLLLQIGAHAENKKDDPNYRIEDRFHDVYKEFNSNPVSDETWGKIYGSSQPREYTVVKTDTLWDISQVLFADPVFWPKIWSFNTDEITNPHEILPGWKIRFFPGTMDTPPALTVVEFEGVLIPQKKSSTPVADIPDSIPYYVNLVPNFDLPKFVKPDRSAQSKIPPMPLPVEILRDKPDYKGKIVELEEGAKVADYGREVFVNLDVDERPGHYTIVKTVEKNKYGFILQYRGELDTMGRINDSENIYRARITKMLDTVELGDMLIPGTIPNVDVTEKPKVASAPFVTIVGGFHSPTDMLFAPYSIVFLDGGAQTGLHEGDVLSIYQEPKSRIANTKQKKSFREIGTLKVIRLQETVATAYILNSKTEIREGDLAGFEQADTGSAAGQDDDNLILE
jgi:hypothetical protein